MEESQEQEETAANLILSYRQAETQFLCWNIMNNNNNPLPTGFLPEHWPWALAYGSHKVKAEKTDFTVLSLGHGQL